MCVLGGLFGSPKAVSMVRSPSVSSCVEASQSIGGLADKTNFRQMGKINELKIDEWKIAFTVRRLTSKVLEIRYSNASSYKFVSKILVLLIDFHLIDLLLINLHLINLRYLAIARPSTCLTALISLLPLGPIVGPYVTF